MHWINARLRHENLLAIDGERCNSNGGVMACDKEKKLGDRLYLQVHIE